MKSLKISKKYKLNLLSYVMMWLQRIPTDQSQTAQICLDNKLQLTISHLLVIFVMKSVQYIHMKWLNIVKSIPPIYEQDWILTKFISFQSRKCDNLYLPYLDSTLNNIAFLSTRIRFYQTQNSSDCNSFFFLRCTITPPTDVATNLQARQLNYLLFIRL